VLQNHPDRPLMHFLWITRQFVHDPILSNDGVSSKPGAIHPEELAQIIEGLNEIVGT